MSAPMDALIASASVSIASQNLRPLEHPNLQHLLVRPGHIAHASPVGLEEQSALANGLPVRLAAGTIFNVRSKTPLKAF